MAAIVDIREFNGVAPGTPTTKTGSTIRFKSVDSPTVDLANPVVRPVVSTARSYEKVLRLRIGATGPVGSITNIRAYSDGGNTLGTGLDIMAGTNASYVQPVNTASVYATVSLFTYTVGAPLTVGSGPYTGTNTDIANFVYLQATVASTASPGLTPSEILTIAYDES